MTTSDDDATRYPHLSEDGRRMLRFMAEHPAAPIYRNASGHRLRSHELPALRLFGSELARSTIDWRINEPPSWLRAHIAQVYEQVPHYQRQGQVPAKWGQIRPVSRADFSRDIAAFVPDSVPTDELINFRTTGTTGHPLLIASHPTVAAKYMYFHQRALRRVGVDLRYGRGQVGVVLLGFQSKCFTYVSVSPLMDESGFAKINLHPNDWREPNHREQYLNALAPELIFGDPISFGELLRIPLAHKPCALISVAMALAPALRTQLEQRFQCPVLDVYSMNEAGPIGVADASEGGFVMLQPKLYVETLDQNSRPLPEGEVGEIAISGGFNFCLPLLRYRTGDFGALRNSPQGPVLTQFSGRQPIRYRSTAGQWFNNIDITHALAGIALSHYQFHQAHDGQLTISLAEQDLHQVGVARDALQALFPGQEIQTALIRRDDKVKQYTSDYPGATSSSRDGSTSAVADES